MGKTEGDEEEKKMRFLFFCVFLDHKLNGNFSFFVVVWLIKSSGIVVFTSLCRTRDCVGKWKVRIRHIALSCGTLDKIPAENVENNF